jgi:hypothetical protein
MRYLKETANNILRSLIMEAQDEDLPDDNPLYDLPDRGRGAQPDDFTSPQDYDRYGRPTYWGPGAPDWDWDTFDRANQKNPYYQPGLRPGGQYVWDSGPPEQFPGPDAHPDFGKPIEPSRYPIFPEFDPNQPNLPGMPEIVDEIPGIREIEGFGDRPYWEGPEGEDLDQPTGRPKWDPERQVYVDSDDREWIYDRNTGRYRPNTPEADDLARWIDNFLRQHGDTGKRFIPRRLRP